MATVAISRSAAPEVEKQKLNGSDDRNELEKNKVMREKNREK